MRFQAILLPLAGLISYVYSQEADVRLHAREFTPEVPSAARRDPGLLEDDVRSLISKRAPTIPAGKDANKLHVWVRLDTRPITYDSRSGATHDGLNQLMKDTGGRHVDVIVGNAKGYNEYGLKFNDKTWQKKANGDGAAVSAYAGPYEATKGEALTYKGQVGDGRRTLNSIGTLATSAIQGKTYHHSTYNCRVFADGLVAQLAPKP
ncbi:hypothetical protein B0H63DRAFT_141488 [Podospora didyma]|uniref:Uncharacterized protein n=1 Tax=Podospora didyma TaxID=330526 RepID=A0AAE0NSF5_9PEZI|nr:hypothetical protein B0H63DRAFT_141488 [Podospora didyma]